MRRVIGESNGEGKRGSCGQDATVVSSLLLSFEKSWWRMMLRTGKIDGEEVVIYRSSVKAEPASAFQRCRGARRSVVIGLGTLSQGIDVWKSTAHAVSKATFQNVSHACRKHIAVKLDLLGRWQCESRVAQPHALLHAGTAAEGRWENIFNWRTGIPLERRSSRLPGSNDACLVSHARGSARKGHQA
jgi:hypothetical protein